MIWGWLAIGGKRQAAAVAGVVCSLMLVIGSVAVAKWLVSPVGLKCLETCRFSVGPLPLSARDVRPMAFEPTDEVVISGTVVDASGAEIGLRVDDGQSSDYASRYNEERKVPAGPFRLSVGLSGLKTPSGRILDHRDVRLIRLFSVANGANIFVDSFFVRPAARLPYGAIGYALGALDAPLPPGFERIGPQDQRLEPYGFAKAVRRPAPDPLIANAVVGVKRLRLAAPAGPTRVTIWSEDPGEWDVLPRALQQRITVNGRELVSRSMTPQTWIASRYLRGRMVEQAITDDAWTAFGRNRGNAHSVDLTVGSDGVDVILSGSERADFVVNAVLIEPLRATRRDGDAPARLAVEQARADWYRSHFPVVQQSSDKGTDGEPVSVLLGAAVPGASRIIRRRAAPDTGLYLRIDVTADSDLAQPNVAVAFVPGGDGLRAQVWSAAWRLERAGTTLVQSNNHLVADAARLPLMANAVRSYDMWLQIPKAQQPGLYRGSIVITGGEHPVSVPIEVEVLPVALPDTTKSAGFYLARAPHLAGYDGAPAEQDRQVVCDLDTMHAFGLDNTAPPLADLDVTSLDRVLADAARFVGHHVTGPWLAYNPLHDLMLKYEPSQGAQIVADAMTRMRHAGIDPPLWSVADEPSNPDQDSRRLVAWIAELRAQVPGIRLAGHLNARDDQAYVGLLDTLLINAGFGIDRDQINKQRMAGKGVWLYNTGAPRVTSGLWLWLTEAERYIQWHARMPTADPFDPLDGREGDWQMFDPMPEVCAPHPDIHRNLLRMAEGVVDQRWLLWLDTQTSDKAVALRARLRAFGEGSFAKARDLKQSDLDDIRLQIMDLVDVAQGQVVTTVGSGGKKYSPAGSP